MWDRILKLLEHNEPFINVAGIFLLALYVIYTVRMFGQMRRQTELQIEAFLVVTHQLTPRKGVGSPPKALELYEKWRGILENNIPGALKTDQLLILELENCGRSDVIHWRVDVNAEVKPGEYLNSNCNIFGESDEWTLTDKGSGDIIRQGTSIEVPVAIVGPFPELIVQWTLEYRDMRDRRYSRYGGDSEFSTKNIFADPPNP